MAMRLATPRHSRAGAGRAGSKTRNSIPASGHAGSTVGSEPWAVSTRPRYF